MSNIETVKSPSDQQIIKKKKKIITSSSVASSSDTAVKSKFENVKSPSDSKSHSTTSETDNGSDTKTKTKKQKKPWNECSKEELEEILASIEEQQSHCRQSINHFIKLMNSAKCELSTDKLTFDQHIEEMSQKFDKSEKKQFSEQSHSRLCHSIGCINDKLFEYGKKYNELEFMKSKVQTHL
jgi:hypothetical protein